MNTEPLLKLQTPAQVRANQYAPLDHETVERARCIVEAVRDNAETALRAYAEQFGDIAIGGKLYFSAADLQAAANRISPRERELLQRVADRIRTFALAQRRALLDIELPLPGAAAGHTFIPVEHAGCYAPGGRFPLPSSVLMTAITARAAGVASVWVASPKPPDITLAAAHIAGADGLLAAGGAHAIAAMASGVGPLPASDVIVGPGSRWVTAAKHIVSDRVGIDMLAGPSELVVLADDSANPDVIAADLLAQAEHDSDAVPVLITTSSLLVDQVQASLRHQLPRLPSRESAGQALQNGCAVLARDIHEAIAVCNYLAPEHLQVMTRDAERIAADLKHCGAIFIGLHAAEVLGDYGAGPNHVLPTGRTARFRAGLSVLAFLRARTWLRVDDLAAAQPLVTDAYELAQCEHLAGHAAAAHARLI